MRLRDETPLDPEVLASLDAIDAVLAGEPVDPRHADLAELALLLADERPAIDPAFATLLDEGVERRFAAAPPPVRERDGSGRRPWLWGPAAGLTAAAVVAVVVVVSSGPSASQRSVLPVPVSSTSASPAAKVAASPAAHGVTVAVVSGSP